MRVFSSALFVSLVTYLVVCCDASRILVWIPTPSISHQVVFRPLTQELARRGHEVVVITTDPAFPKGQAPENLTEVDMHDESNTIVRQEFLEMPKGNKKKYIDNLEPTFDLTTPIIDNQINRTISLGLLEREQKFDMLILESLFVPTLALSHIFKVPVIQASSSGAKIKDLDHVGAPTHPILYPINLHQRICNLTIWEKIEALYNQYIFDSLRSKIEKKENAMLRKHFGEEFPPISELENNIGMLFLNIHPIFEGNHPVPPGVVHTWGMYKKTEMALPEDIKTYLDSSKNGVIYMSFGSNTDPTKLPETTIQIFLNVLCQLPYDILFKWDADEMPGRCKNIRIGRWFPQPNLLRHPKIKLFITQGGLQSTDEAISAGVPLVGIPMTGDQWYNAEKYAQFKIGVQLDAETITEENFRNAITTVINDESYRQNIKKLDELMRDEPIPALDRAVWWVEHVLRHGGARHLRSPAANISWAQYFEVQLITELVIISFMVLTFICMFLCWLVKLALKRLCHCEIAKIKAY